MLSRRRRESRRSTAPAGSDCAGIVPAVIRSRLRSRQALDRTPVDVHGVDAHPRRQPLRAVEHDPLAPAPTHRARRRGPTPDAAPGPHAGPIATRSPRRPAARRPSPSTSPDCFHSALSAVAKNRAPRCDVPIPAWRGPHVARRRGSHRVGTARPRCGSARPVRAGPRPRWRGYRARRRVYVKPPERRLARYLEARCRSGLGAGPARTAARLAFLERVPALRRAGAVRPARHRERAAPTCPDRHRGSPARLALDRPPPRPHSIRGRPRPTPASTRR